MLFLIFQKNQEIDEVENLIEERKSTVQYLQNKLATEDAYIPRSIIDYDSYLRGELKQQD